MRAVVLCIGLVLAVVIPATGQQGELVSRAVGEQPLSYGTGALLVAALSGTISPDQPPSAEEVIRLLRSLEHRVPEGGGDDSLSYGDFALLMMQVFDLRGNLRYEAFPSSASAFAELQSRSLIAPGVYAGTPIPGDVAVDILSDFLEGSP